MRIAIIGSGHGGCAMAAVLAKHGHEVSMVKLGSAMHLENFQVLQQRRSIRLAGIEGEGEFPLRQVTSNPADAIPDAQLVLTFYVSNYHGMIARRIASLLHEGQVLVLNPGYAGTLLFHNEIRAAGKRGNPLYAEFETLPFTSRIGPAGTVTITSRNVRHPFASFPASRARELSEFFAPVLGECVPRKHLLEVALHNPNLVIHTIGVLMNAAAVEHKERGFALYRDGFSPAIWSLVARLDEEKMSVLERIGAPRISYFDEFRLRTFRDTTIDPYVGFRRYADEAPPGPFSIEHRYITEDVPMGLGLLHSIGRAVGVATPVCDSLIHIASSYLPNRDLWGEARLIERLWSGTLEGLLKMLTR